jgi:hypothetical protein
MRGIKTGIGVGEAQVFDTKDIVNTFIKTYQLKQKQDQLFAEKIADNLSKFDTTGLTGKDLEEATKMYDQLRTLNQNTDRLGRNERTLLDANIRKGMNDLKTFSTNAKQFYKDKSDFGIEYNKDKYAFVDGMESTVDKLTKLSYGEALAQNLSDVNRLRMMRTPDNRLVDESLNDMAKIVKGLADKTKPIVLTQKTPGGTSVNQIYHVADPKAVDAVVLGIISDSAKKFNWVDNFKRTFPEQPTPNDETLVKYIKNAYETKSGGIENAYRFKTSEQMAPKPTAGPKPTDSDQFAGAVNATFSTDPAARQRAINQIKAHSKGRISDIVYNQDGTISFTPMVKLGSKYVPAKDPITLESPTDFNNQLGALGITQSGFGVTTKLNQGSTNKPDGGGMITVILSNGKEGEIPASKLGAFLKKYPGSKRK